MTRHPSHSVARRRRGTVLIVAMIVTIALAGTVLALCRTMRVEAMASANLAASAQASAVARGAEQYVVALITDRGDEVRDLGEENFAAVRVGEGIFWIMRPDYDDDPPGQTNWSSLADMIDQEPELDHEGRPAQTEWDGPYDQGCECELDWNCPLHRDRLYLPGVLIEDARASMRYEPEPW